MISKEELEYLAQISKINLNENESRKFPILNYLRRPWK
jgi:hypothetical protein